MTQSTETTTLAPGTRVRLIEALGVRMLNVDSDSYESPPIGTLGSVVTDPDPEGTDTDLICITLDGYRYNSEREFTQIAQGWRDSRFEVVEDFPAPELPFPASEYVPGSNPAVVNGDRVVCDGISPSQLHCYVGQPGVWNADRLIRFDTKLIPDGHFGNSQNWVADSWHRESPAGVAVPTSAATTDVDTTIAVGDVVRVVRFIAGENRFETWSSLIGQIARVTEEKSEEGDNDTSYTWRVRTKDGRQFWAIVEKVTGEEADNFLAVPTFTIGQEFVVSEHDDASVVGEVVTITDSTIYPSYDGQGDRVYARPADGRLRLFRICQLAEATVEKRIEVAVVKATKEATRAAQRHVIEVAMAEGERRDWCSELEAVLTKKLGYDLDSFARRAAGSVTVTFSVEEMPMSLRKSEGGCDFDDVYSWIWRLFGEQHYLGNNATGILRLDNVDSVNLTPGEERGA